MKRVTIFLKLFLVLKSIYCQNIYTLEINSKWKILSLTENNTTIQFPNEKTFYLETLDLNKSKAKVFDRKNRKIYKKLGYKGMLIYTDEKDINSKYYCQITAFFKTKKDNVLQIIWNDNFKQQEQLSKIDPKIRMNLWEILNGETQITANGDTIKFTATRVDSLQKIILSINLKKEQDIKRE